MVQATRLKSWSISYGALLLIYNLAWLVALGVGLTYSKQVATFFAGTGVDQVFFITILRGGLGGVSGALRSMWVHIAKDRDFDPQFLMWYIINPILGTVLAIFAYWVAQLGLVAVTGTGTTGNGVFVFYVLGWLVGFQQNVAYQLVEQAIKMFKKDDVGKAQDAPTKPPQPQPKLNLSLNYRLEISERGVRVLLRSDLLYLSNPYCSNMFSKRPLDYYILWGVAATSLLLNLYTIASLISVRQQAGIAFANAAKSLEAVKTSRVEYTVKIDKEIPLPPTPINLTVQVPINQTIPRHHRQCPDPHPTRYLPD